jgi:hypothetical protein
VKLTIPWRDYARGYAGASVYIQNDVCVLYGLIRLDKWNVASWNNHLLTLPGECHPRDGQLIFHLNSNQETHRVDVYRDGRVTWQAGVTRNNPFISLSGITFPRVPGTPLELNENWVPYGKGFRAPTYKVTAAKTCYLSGVVKGNGHREILKLPSDCRPSANLVFSVDHHKYTQRFEVKADGTVLWTDGPRFWKWTSLDGISFAVTHAED